MPSLVQRMRVTHGCADVFVPHEFLDRTDIVSGLKQMRGIGQTSFVNRFDPAQMLLEEVFKRLGEHRDPVLTPFAVAHSDLVAGEVDILDP